MLLLKVLVLLTLVSLVVASGMTCAFCQFGLATILNKIQNTPNSLEQLGWRMAQQCDSYPNKQARIECRKMFREHTREIFNKVIDSGVTDREKLCHELGFC